MTRTTMRLVGNYVDLGKIRLGNSQTLHWSSLSTDALPNIPYGTVIEMSITYDQIDYVSGEGGIVWATYDPYQAETVRNALDAQRITSDVQERPLGRGCLYVLQVRDQRQLRAAMDFIWRDETGLELRPDWWYPAGAQNQSFEKWVEGL